MAAKASASPAPAKAAAAPAAPAPVVAAPAVPAAAAPPKRIAPAPEPAPPAEAPSPAEVAKKEKAEFSQRMKRAKATVKAKEAAAKGGAAPAAAAVTAPADGDEAPEPAAAPAAAGPTKTPRELMDAGDLDGAFEAAFGKKPHDFKIDSRRWEEWRKAGLRQKQELASKKQVADADAARQRDEMATTIRRAQEVYGPMVQARKLYEGGDVVGALKAAFGDDINAFQKKALAQFHGKNPEVEALRRELAEERRVHGERQRQEQLELEQAQHTARVRAHKEKIKAELEAGEDAQLKQLAADPAFTERVFQIQRKNYDRENDEVLPIADAADMARHELLRRFGPALGLSAHRSESAESVQPGSKAANAVLGKKPVSRNLSQRGAVEASEPGRALTDVERRRKYTDLAKAQAAE